MRLLLLSALGVALWACHPNAQQAPSTKDGASTTADSIKGVHRDRRGYAPPAAEFDDPDGTPAKLAQFKGKPVLVNLWATWCAPCVKELPTLDKLAKTGAVSVVAVSEDNAPHASVVAFLKAQKISMLKPYQDPQMALSGALGPETVLPTSILIGADGKEVWRYVGDFDWTSQQAAKLLAEAGATTKSS